MQGRFCVPACISSPLRKVCRAYMQVQAPALLARSGYLCSSARCCTGLRDECTLVGGHCSEGVLPPMSPQFFFVGIYLCKSKKCRQAGTECKRHFSQGHGGATQPFSGSLGLHLVAV